MKRKFLTLFLYILTIVTVTSTVSIYANAANENVTLTVKDKWAYSSSISAKGTKATVYNAASSKHDVYGIIQYKSGSEYVTDNEFLVGEGKTVTKNSASYFISKKAWRLQLNPYGVGTKNCTADGEIFSR